MKAADQLIGQSDWAELNNPDLGEYKEVNLHL